MMLVRAKEFLLLPQPTEFTIGVIGPNGQNWPTGITGPQGHRCQRSWWPNRAYWGNWSHRTGRCDKARPLGEAPQV